MRQQLIQQTEQINATILRRPGNSFTKSSEIDILQHTQRALGYKKNKYPVSNNYNHPNATLFLKSDKTKKESFKGYRLFGQVNSKLLPSVSDNGLRRP